MNTLVKAGLVKGTEESGFILTADGEDVADVCLQRFDAARVRLSMSRLPMPCLFPVYLVHSDFIHLLA